jgi:hypothetical protein
MKKPMYIKFTFLVAVIISGYGCKKEVTSMQSNSNTFFKQYGGVEADYNSYIGQSNESGYLMLGSDGAHQSINASYINDKGHLLWDKKIAVGRNASLTHALLLDDGNFLINDRVTAFLTKINTKGEVIFDLPFVVLSNLYLYSKLIESTDKSCYLAYTNGASQGAPSNSFISEIDPNSGDELRYLEYKDASFGGKVINFEVAKTDGNSFFILGGMYKYKPSWDWSDRMKLFLAKAEGDQVRKVKIFSETDDDVQELICGHAALKEGGVVVVSAITNAIFDGLKFSDPTFSVRKIDDDLNVVWSKVIDLKVNAALPYSIKETYSGDFIITGECENKYKLTGAGFVVRMNNKGEIIEQKISDLFQGHGFMDAVYTKDNDWLITGSIQNFGKGMEQSSRFYLKTDKDFKF